MTFTTWCACHQAAVVARLEIWDQERQRRLFIHDWELERARLWAIVEARMNLNPSLARDIREHISEP